MNKRSIAGIVVAAVIGIGIVILISYNSLPSSTGTNSTKGESVGISGNVSVTKIPTTGNHFTVQLNESIGITHK